MDDFAREKKMACTDSLSRITWWFLGTLLTQFFCFPAACWAPNRTWLVPPVPFCCQFPFSKSLKGCRYTSHCVSMRWIFVFVRNSVLYFGEILFRARKNGMSFEKNLEFVLQKSVSSASHLLVESRRMGSPLPPAFLQFENTNLETRKITSFSLMFYVFR